MHAVRSVMKRDVVPSTHFSLNFHIIHVLPHSFAGTRTHDGYGHAVLFRIRRPVTVVAIILFTSRVRAFNCVRQGALTDNELCKRNDFRFLPFKLYAVIVGIVLPSSAVRCDSVRIPRKKTVVHETVVSGSKSVRHLMAREHAIRPDDILCDSITNNGRSTVWAFRSFEPSPTDCWLSFSFAECVLFAALLNSKFARLHEPLINQCQRHRNRSS